jgi:hypothetical protein
MLHLRKRENEEITVILRRMETVLVAYKNIDP